jgi:hypothetical protein
VVFTFFMAPPGFVYLLLDEMEKLFY